MYLQIELSGKTTQHVMSMQVDAVSVEVKLTWLHYNFPLAQ